MVYSKIIYFSLYNKYTKFYCSLYNFRYFKITYLIIIPVINNGGSNSRLVSQC